MAFGHSYIKKQGVVAGERTFLLTANCNTSKTNTRHLPALCSFQSCIDQGNMALIETEIIDLPS